MNNNSDLKLKYLAIGSLPHSVVNEAIVFVEKTFPEIPFWPQLAQVSRKEDMIIQYLEHIPGVVFSDEKIYIDSESEEFFEKLETFFTDFETEENLDNYAISEEFSSTIRPYLEIVKRTKPKYAKGQVTGPFTLSTSICDQNDKCAFYDETLREVITKSLILNARWQIEQIKKVSPDTKPIIFIDEPSISQLGTSAFLTISNDDVLEILKEVSDSIQKAGGLSAIHCCGKCDWSLPIKAGVNLLNLDAFFYAQSLSVFSEDVKDFINRGGIIVWGVVPTLDKEALESSDINTMVEKFETAVKYLEQKGLSKDEIINSSMVSPSCGAGSLSIDLAVKAMNLTKDLSHELMRKYDCKTCNNR